MKSLVETLESAATSNKTALTNLASKVGNTTNNYNTMHNFNNNIYKFLI